MDYLDDSIVDPLTSADYPDFSDEVYYSSNDGFIYPSGGDNMNENTSEPIIPLESQKESSSFSMSTAFSAYMNFGDGGPDVVLMSRDAVHFFVRRNRLLNVSNNQFALLLSPYIDSSFQTAQQPIQLTEDAQTLNIVLHILYGVSFHVYSPSLEILLQAIQTLEKYGVVLSTHLIPGTPLFDDIVLKTPYQPLEVYIVAADHDLFQLAQIASGYLLSISLLSIPRMQISRLNSDYLAMLYNLHIARTLVLQRLISRPPDEHEATFQCGFSAYQAMKSAWSVATSSFILNANPDVSAALIRNTLESLKFSLPCIRCRKCVQDRVNEILLKWSITPRTICRDTGYYFSVLSPQDSVPGITYTASILPTWSQV
ncbi:hypothetical protein QCA50_020570 [Cerrena zonata]|uniref:BTB domain-containing protein n=1 Tax=Cerrena zonata TaxID=2478898 RepID=A0AAW0F918_9APHY